ncbi:MAG: tryptophanyl-tRNA synthetase [Candidatus Azotimanducaceae bacterium]
MSLLEAQNRVLSGMRPSGPLHLGQYHGVLKNWIKLQHEYDCMFFVADWHALTTQYENPELLESNVWELIIDWLAVGINPGSTSLFIQSKVPEHAELNLLLSMITPLAWLERVPSYKDQQIRLHERDLSTYGFLGYPLLQSADILIYKAGHVPVSGDQVPHVEMTREVARRFNHLFGKDEGFVEMAEVAIKKLGRKNAKMYRELRKDFLEKGVQESLEKAQAMLQGQANISLGDRDRLFGYLDGGGRPILPEPRVLLSDAILVPGIDGNRMSKSSGNCIGVREAPASIEKKIKTMTTDPARVRRRDVGDPAKCPVFTLHEIYSDEEVKTWVRQGCTSGGIGCLDCKRPLIDEILKEQKPMLERAKQYEDNPNLVKSIVAEGSEKARSIAKSTLEDVRQAMGLNYR